MKKRIYMILPVLLTALLIFPALAEAAAVKLRVVVDEAGIRLKADHADPFITQIPLGAVLDATEKTGEWYAVSLPPDERGFVVRGYIHETSVEVINISDTAPQPNPPVSNTAPPPRQQQPAYPVYVSPPTGTMGFKLMGGLSLGSLSHSDLDLSDEDEADWKKYQQGIIAGFGMETGGLIGLEIDALYFQKGARYEGQTTENGDDYSAKINVIIDEISVPVLLKFKFMPGSSPYIFGGGEVAYILSSKVKYNITSDTAGQESGTEDFMENINRLDYGIVAGAGFEFNIGGTSIFVEGRYHQGLANLVKEVETYEDGWVKTKALVIVGGIKF